MTDRSPEPSEVEAIWLWRCRECGWVGFSEDGHCRQFDEHPDGPRIPLESVQYVPLDAARGRSREDTVALTDEYREKAMYLVAEYVEQNPNAGEIEIAAGCLLSLSAVRDLLPDVLARFGAARTEEK